MLSYFFLNNSSSRIKLSLLIYVVDVERVIGSISKQKETDDVDVVIESVVNIDPKKVKYVYFSFIQTDHTIISYAYRFIVYIPILDEQFLPWKLNQLLKNEYCHKALTKVICLLHVLKVCLIRGLSLYV